MILGIRLLLRLAANSPLNPEQKFPFQSSLFPAFVSLSFSETEIHTKLNYGRMAKKRFTSYLQQKKQQYNECRRVFLFIYVSAHLSARTRLKIVINNARRDFNYIPTMYCTCTRIVSWGLDQYCSYLGLKKVESSVCWVYSQAFF